MKFWIELLRLNLDMSRLYLLIVVLKSSVTYMFRIGSETTVKMKLEVECLGARTLDMDNSALFVEVGGSSRCGDADEVPSNVGFRARALGRPCKKDSGVEGGFDLAPTQTIKLNRDEVRVT